MPLFRQRDISHQFRSEGDLSLHCVPTSNPTCVMRYPSSKLRCRWIGWRTLSQDSASLSGAMRSIAAQTLLTNDIVWGYRLKSLSKRTTFVTELKGRRRRREDDGGWRSSSTRGRAFVSPRPHGSNGYFTRFTLASYHHLESRRLN